MSDLVTRRNQLLTMQTHGKKPTTNITQEHLIDHYPYSDRSKKVETKIAKLIESSPEYQAKSTILQSVPCVGKVLAASLISNVP